MDADLANRRYGIVIDAGSSGSRLHIFSWVDPNYLRNTVPSSRLAGSLPTIEPGSDNSDDWIKKTTPGIREYTERPGDVGEHLEPLLDHATRVIPPSHLRDTPIYLLATAGLRLASDDAREQVLANACSYIRENYQFYVGRCQDHFQTITGEEEGLYGWLAINYMMGGFDDGGVDMKAPPIGSSEHDPSDQDLPDLDRDSEQPHRHTLGFLDMGGASTQIAFEPSAQASAAHADDLTAVRLRTLDGSLLEYNVFVTTFLGYGTNEARVRYVKEQLLDDAKQVLDINKGLESVQFQFKDPCLPRNLKLDETHTNPHVPLTGTGSFTECLARVETLLNKSTQCEDEPCLFNGVHTPPIDFNVNTFIGVSEYWYSSHDILGLGGAYDYAEFEQKSAEYCNADWEDILSRPQYKDIPLNRLEMQCFKSAWLSNVLHGGFGLPRFGEQGAAGSNEQLSEVLEKAQESVNNKNWKPAFQSMNAIKDIQVTWTLGAMLLLSSGSYTPAGHVSHHDTMPPAHRPPPYEEEYSERMLDEYNHVLLILIILFILASSLLYRSRASKPWLAFKRILDPRGFVSGSGFRSGSNGNTTDFSALESGVSGSGAYGRGFRPKAALKNAYLSTVHFTRSAWWSLSSRIWPEPTSYEPPQHAEEMIESITIAGFDGANSTTPMSHHGGTPAGSFSSPGLSAIPESAPNSPGFETAFRSHHHSSRPPKTAPKFFGRFNKKRFSGDSHSFMRNGQAPADGCVVNTSLSQKQIKNAVELTARSGSSTNLFGLGGSGPSPGPSSGPSSGNGTSMFSAGPLSSDSVGNNNVGGGNSSNSNGNQPWKQGWIAEDEEPPQYSPTMAGRKYQDESKTNHNSPLLAPSSSRYGHLIHQDGTLSAPTSTVNLGSSLNVSADERDESSCDGDGDDEGEGTDTTHPVYLHNHHHHQQQQQYQQSTHPFARPSLTSHRQTHSVHTLGGQSARLYQQSQSPSLGRPSIRSTGLLSGTNFETGGGSMTPGADSELDNGYLSGNSTSNNNSFLQASLMPTNRPVSRSVSPLSARPVELPFSNSTSSLVQGRHGISEFDQQLVSRGSSENLRRGSSGTVMSP